jgi:hypothetical protein
MEDDPAIAGDLRLLRRVPELLVHDGEIEKSNFDERDEGHGLSVTVWESPQDLEDVLTGHENFGVVSVKSSVLRAEGVIIARVPLDGNPNHCEVFPRLSTGARRRIKRQAKWVYFPDWVCAEHRVPVEEF